MSKRRLPILDSPWSIGEDKYLRILDLLSKNPVNGIIEFGSGKSTIRLGHDFPNSTIVSVENDRRYVAETMRLLDEFGIENVKAIHAPLRLLRIGLRFFLTYDAAALTGAHLPPSVDFILVDGPVEAETLRGREATLYISFALLRTGGIVVLDDYHRDSARRVVRNWLSSYPGGIEINDDFDNDLATLTKTRDMSCRLVPGIAPVLDNWWAFAILLARKSWRKAKRR